MGWKQNNLFKIKNELENESIYFTGYMPDHQLPLLLTHAISLCYVSHYEGFGLPILEAMRCGTPVIYGNNSSQPEVAGRGGLGVKSDDIVAIQEAMYSLLNDPEKRKILADEARLQVKKFSWLKAAFETLCAYEDIIAAKKT
jgi:glycosyltransferase involved in cell wall biosynthesis